MALTTDSVGIPIIDIAPFRAAKEPDIDSAAVAVAHALGTAFETSGFAVITGHGIPPELAQETYALSAMFHDLDSEVKAAVKNYVPHGNENVSQLIGVMDAPNDLSDRLAIHNESASYRWSAPQAVGNPREQADHDADGRSVRAEDVRTAAAAMPSNDDHYFFAINQHLSSVRSSCPTEMCEMCGSVSPQLIPGLQSAAETYFDAVHGVWVTLTRMSEVALGLPLLYFDSFYDKDWKSGSLRCYPTLDSEDDLLTGQLRFGAHTDSGGLTILRTDMEGLQVQVGGEWHDVPALPEALVVNVARLLARWTNDRWTSAVHRVKNDGITTQRKLTLGMFTAPTPDALIEVLPSCVPHGDEPKYAPIVASEHSRQRGLLHVPGAGKNVPAEFWRERWHTEIKMAARI